MSDNKDKVSFWTTIPGCLTGIAAVLTAIGGLITALVAAGILQLPSSPTPAPVSATNTPTRMPPTYTSTPVRPTDAPTMTDTPTPARPDLVVVAISSPTCVRDHRTGAQIKQYVRHIITIRNIGSGSTSAFGPFSSRVTLDVGGRRYSLEEWASRFNGIVGSPDLNISNLGPNQDAEITLGIDLRGSTNYSIEVIANSGPNTIPESNTTNDIRTQNFASNCS